jgi:hypothetical protein
MMAEGEQIAREFYKNKNTNEKSAVWETHPNGQLLFISHEIS